MRANLRRADLVCRAGTATFICLLPGLRWESAEEPVGRVREALVQSCGAGQVALGVDFWEAGQAPATVLARCLRAVHSRLAL